MAAAQGSADDSGRGAGQSSVFRLEREAHALADRLPELLLDALRIANTVAHGIHGRRRAGPGETFWQFRQFQASDPRAPSSTGAARPAPTTSTCASANGRRRTPFWLWPDLSPSMDFRSHLSPITKRDRALVLMLAAAELLVRGGERVALLGLTPPTASRKATSRIAEALAAHEARRRACRRACRRTARLSPLLERAPVRRLPRPARDHRASASNELAEGGVTGHLVQVLDPAEETLAYEGRTEFRSPEGSERWVADRVESLRAATTRAKLAAHRAEHRAGRAPHRLVVPRASHRPAGGRAAADAHHAAAGHGRRLPLEGRTRCDARGRRAMTLRRPRLPQPLAARGPAGAAGHLVAAAHRAAAAAPHRVPADPHPGRPREPGEDAGARRPGG